MYCTCMLLLVCCGGSTDVVVAVVSPIYTTPGEPRDAIDVVGGGRSVLVVAHTTVLYQ